MVPSIFTSFLASIFLIPVFGISGLFFMSGESYLLLQSQGQTSPSEGVVMMVGEPNPPICKECRVVIKDTVWEIVFQKPEGWGIDNGNNDVVEVFKATGDQWYFVEKFPSRLAFALEDGRRVFFDFATEMTVEEGDSSSEFKAVGWKGTLVRNMQNSGFDILYFKLPDNKYSVSIKGVSGEYFDDFLKTVQLQK